MSYELLVGLNVTDEKLYTEYRKAITPILETYGGGFRYDFKISEVLKNSGNQPINRVFTIFFRDQKAKEDFFNNPQYLIEKQRLYSSSVDATTVISNYEY